MDWGGVGSWLKQNAGPGAALVGSLLTGNVPGAVAAGVAMVRSATGEAEADKVLASLQSDPATVVRLRELALQDADSVRKHLLSVAEIEARDKQAEHQETQATIRSGDNAEDIVVKRTRPLQSWASLVACFGYVAWREAAGREQNIEMVMVLLALPWAYAGLRQIGKAADSFAAAKANHKEPQ